MKRFELKNKAKAALNDNFGAKMLLFIIPIIVGILSGGNSLRTTFGGRSTNYDMMSGTAWTAWTVLAFLGIFIAVISIVFALFIAVVTTAAMFNYMKIYRGERTNPQFKNIFVPFYDGSAGKIILLNFIKGLILIALALIPVIGWGFAIYLSLGWAQSTYVLFDKLEKGEYQGVMDVLGSSSVMMRGLRGNYFIFQLSFFWWYLLNGVTGGFAGFWVIPYTNMARVAYYENIGNL